MTNKEAIKLFRFYQGEIICDKEMKEALDIAIKALEFTDEYCHKTFNNYLKGKQILARRKKNE